MTKSKLEEIKVKTKLEKVKADSLERISHAYSIMVIVTGMTIAIIIKIIQG